MSSFHSFSTVLEEQSKLLFVSSFSQIPNSYLTPPMRQSPLTYTYYGTPAPQTPISASSSGGIWAPKSMAQVGLIIGIGGLSVAAAVGVKYLLTGEKASVPTDNSALDPAAGAPKDEGAKIEKPKLVLHQCPRGYTLPCISPFPLKLETFLRVAEIPYEVRNTPNPCRLMVLDEENV